MQRNIFLPVLTIFIIFISFLQIRAFDIKSSQTEIYLIGTVHYSSGNYNSDSLTEILYKINPDVILVESDSTYMTSDFDLTEDIKNSFLETRAITKYRSLKQVELRPYDISGRDDFLNDHERIRNQRNFFSDLDDLNRSEKLNNFGTNMLIRILGMMNIAEQMSNSGPTYINAPEGSRKIDTINYYSYEALDILIKDTPELGKYKTYWRNEYEYWNNRNQVMVENILAYKDAFEGKKIVVLCGFAHKNIIKNGLVERSGEENINVREFWEL